MRQSKVIGITGGIGSGKSTFLEFAASEYDCSVIRADEIGRLLMRPGKCIYKALVKHFGGEILLPDRRIDTGKLSQKAFSEPGVLEFLNAVEHPLIRREIKRRITMDPKPLIFLEAALLKEGGLAELCAEIWLVRSTAEVRILRLMSDRGYSREKCEAILKRQMSDEEYLAYADRVIMNNGSPEELKGVLDAEIRRLLNHD